VSVAKQRVIMTSQPMRVQVAMIAVLLLLGSVFVCVADDASECQIPEGDFDGMIYDIQIREPYYG